MDMIRTFTFIVGSLFGSMAFAQTTLTVEVQLSKTQGGTLRAALCPSESAFNSEKGCSFRAMEANGKMVPLTFENVEAGTYAVKIFQDLDGDEKMGTNAIGIPNEPFGFSNNAMGNFGPPSFKQAAFEVGKQPLVIKLKLRG